MLINTITREIETKLIEFTSDSYAEYNQYSDEKNPKFEFGYHVRITEYKNIFTKGYTQNWSEQVFVVSKISDLNGEPLTGSFYEREL